MLDIKTLTMALEQLEQEKKIPKDKIIDAIEQSLAAAYKKDYGKKGQIVRASLDMDTGSVDFTQVKIVVDDTTVRFVELAEDETMSEATAAIVSQQDEKEEDVFEGDDERPVYNPEKHILIEDAQKLKANASLGDEIIFPLELKEDFGRIAAQTAKQVIMQRIREAERGVIMGEYADREGEIMNGTVQKVTPNVIIVDFGRATGILTVAEQIPGERFRTGQRIRAYVTLVEDSSRGVNIQLSRRHPRFLSELFALESPEVASGTVEIKSIAREPGARSKVAVLAHEDNIDPIGSLVGQKGVRVSTVKTELSGENIDIIEYNADPVVYIANALSPAKVLSVDILAEEHEAKVLVTEDQLSLAIGKGGQNARLAAKLTGWKIDISGAQGETQNLDTPIAEEGDDDGGTYQSLSSLKTLVNESDAEETEQIDESSSSAETTEIIEDTTN